MAPPLPLPSGEGDSLFYGFIDHATDAGVGVLDIEHGVFVGLLGGEFEVEIHRGVVVAHEVEEPGDIGAGLLFLFGCAVGFEGFADLVDEVNQGVDIAIALAHGGGFAVLEEADNLEDLDFEVVFGPGESGLALVAFFDGRVDEGFVLREGFGVGEGGDLVAEHGGDDGGEAGDVTVVVGAEDGDEFVGVGGAVEFIFVVGDIAGDVGEASVGAFEDAVLVVAEFCGAEPDGVGYVLVINPSPAPPQAWGGNFLIIGFFFVVGLCFFEDFFDLSAFGEDDFGAGGLVVGDVGGEEVVKFLFDNAGIVEGLFGEPGVEINIKPS